MISPEAIGGFITTYGFPIVMCLMLFWQSNTQMKELSSVIAANTEATNRLVEKIGGEIK